MTWKTKQPIYRYVILFCVAAGWLLIWPAGVIKDEKISRTAADYSMNTGPVGEVAAIQEFIPQYDEIKSVGVDIGKLDGQANQGTLYLHFFDEGLQEFASYPQKISDMKDGELTDIVVNLKLKAGARYYVSVQCEDFGDMPPVLHYRSLSGNGPLENQHFYYGPVVIEDASANIRYIYKIPLTIPQILFYDSLILLIGVVVADLIKHRHMGREENEQFDEAGGENRK